MRELLTKISAGSMKKKLPDIRPGDTVRVHQRIREGDKTRGQVFEGVVIARKHGSGVSATITVRKISFGVGVERVFPLHSPVVEKFEVVRRAKVRRAKLYYLRGLHGKKARMKAKAFVAIVQEEPEVETAQPEETLSEESSGPSESAAEEAPVGEKTE